MMLSILTILKDDNYKPYMKLSKAGKIQELYLYRMSLTTLSKSNITGKTEVHPE